MTPLASLLPPDVREPACRLARRVVERACDERVSNEGLKFLLRQAAAELAAAPLEDAVHPRALREPTYQVVVDVMARVFPADAHSLVYPSLRGAFDDVRFADAAPERKTFRVIDEDGVALAGLTVEVVHGNDAIARRRADADGWVEVTDLPGHRFVVRFPDGRRVITRSGERRPTAPLRIEAGMARRVRAAAAPRYAATGYLDGPVAGTPLAELKLGAADELGAETYGVAPSTYAGWIVSLQTDLGRLGFYDGPVDGMYGLWTARAVAALQDEAARCDHTSGRITYHGPLDGVANAATREEIRRWFAERRTRHRARLTPQRQVEIIRKAVEVVEPEGDPYAFLEADEVNGAVFGLGKFSQKRGDLGELLELWLFADAHAFDRVFGPTGRILMFQLTMEHDEVRLMTKVASAWKDRFLRAAAIPTFRRQQEALTRDNVFAPLLDAAREHGVVSARGLAILYRTNLVAGWDAAVGLAKALGPRPHGVRTERHLRDAHEKAGGIEVIAKGVPHLVEEIRRLAGCVGVFDDCEELWWW
jgi:hypothetical protein